MGVRTKEEKPSRSSNVFPNKAFKNPNSENIAEVRNIVMKMIVKFFIARLSENNMATIKTSNPLIIPLMIPPDTKPNIITKFLVGDTNISSMLLCHFMRKNEKTVWLNAFVITGINTNPGMMKSI